MVLNLHGFTLQDAIEEVLWKIEEFILKDIDCLSLIHGYRHGQVLKNYFRSQEFLRVAAQYGYQLRLILNKRNEGITTLKLKKRR